MEEEEEGVCVEGGLEVGEEATGMLRRRQQRCCQEEGRTASAAAGSNTAAAGASSSSSVASTGQLYREGRGEEAVPFFG